MRTERFSGSGGVGSQKALHHHPSFTRPRGSPCSHEPPHHPFRRVVELDRKSALLEQLAEANRVRALTGLSVSPSAMALDQKKL